MARGREWDADSNTIKKKVASINKTVHACTENLKGGWMFYVQSAGFANVNMQM